MLMVPEQVGFFFLMNKDGSNLLYDTEVKAFHDIKVKALQGVMRVQEKKLDYLEYRFDSLEHIIKDFVRNINMNREEEKNLFGDLN